MLLHLSEIDCIVFVGVVDVVGVVWIRRSIPGEPCRCSTEQHLCLHGHRTQQRSGGQVHGPVVLWWHPERRVRRGRAVRWCEPMRACVLACVRGAQGGGRLKKREDGVNKIEGRTNLHLGTRTVAHLSKVCISGHPYFKGDDLLR